MNSYEQRVNDFIQRHVDISPEKGAVVVALSGGADSVALLAVMVTLGYDCVAAHCNFHLRGEESDRDMAHAMAVAEALGVKCETVHFNVPARMESTGESMEMACRELRYDWFSKLRVKYRAQALATGHHMEDNVETMLMNMMRGTGIAGASGIRPQTNRRVSPMLEMTKQEILDYLEYKGLTYVTDSSNMSNDVTRNRLRNGILTQLEQEYPGAMERISRSLGNLREDAELLEDAVAEWRGKYMDGQRILTDLLQQQERRAELILLHILKPYGFRREQCQAILEAPSGSRFPAGSHEVVMNRGFAILQTAAQEVMPSVTLKSLQEPNPFFTTEIVAPEDFAPRRDNNVIYIDLDKTPDNAVWEIRPPRQGDRMEPFGMHGQSKLLSDIFNDAKTDSVQKSSAAVLTCNNIIIWLLGVRGSNHFRVGKKSRRILKITTCG